MSTKAEQPNDGSKANGAVAKNDLSPNDELAQQVVAVLVKDGLVSEEDGKKILARLAAGTLDEAGWKLVFENQLDRKEAAIGGH